MALKFQYNKTALQNLRRQLSIREKALPTLKSKEAALRLEVRKITAEIELLKEEYQKLVKENQNYNGFWTEFPEIVKIKKINSELKNIAGVLVNIFIVPVLVFFLLTDFPDFKNFTNKLVERFNMQKIVEHLSQFEALIGKYFRGMFLVGTILSVLYSLVLYIVDVKGWLFIGILTGYGAMIPYVGFTIGLISSVIATIYTFHDFIHPLYTVIGFVIVQVLESMVITPKIVGDSLGISPVVVIVGLMIGGALGGFIGMIIALPIAAFIKILIDTYIFKKPLPVINKHKQKHTNKEENKENNNTSEQ